MQSQPPVPEETSGSGIGLKVVLAMAMLVGLGGTGALVALSIKNEPQRFTKEQVVGEKRKVGELGPTDQLAKWKEWAKTDHEPTLQQEALIQLAWARDPDTVPLATRALSSGDKSVRATAAMALAEMGSPAADSAKPALLKALASADLSNKPQIVWALTVLQEPTAVDAMIATYKAGHLSTLTRLDGYPAFDPEVLSAAIGLDKLAGMAGDETASIRQLAAVALARTNDPKWLDVLVKLVADKEIDVAREAAAGLGGIATEAATGPLLDALSRADRDSRPRFLTALRDGVGGRGLVLALRTVKKDKDKPELEPAQLKIIFDMIRELADPRAADLLVDYIAKTDDPHWKWQAAMRLAEVGDIRAATTLGVRLGQHPEKLYDKKLFPERVRDDNERVYSARMLADLAVLYPDKKGELLKAGESGALKWITTMPQPHANALRFLVAAGSTEIPGKLKAWADPADPLPKEDQKPPMPPPYEIAQSALRYLGWSKDPAAFALLEKQMGRRDPKLDISSAALEKGGLAILGMTLRSLSYGASQGFAQFGDSKAYPILVKHIENAKEHEDSRREACNALAWVASDEQMKEILKKVREAKTDPASIFTRGCYIETLLRRPTADANLTLVDMITPSLDLETRLQIGRALGGSGVTGPAKDKLLEKLKDPQVKATAALALLLGGDKEAARKALLAYQGDKGEAMEELKGYYARSFEFFSTRAYERGDLARWAENAEDVAHLKVNDVLQDWPRMTLTKVLSTLELDEGPHSITRVVLRVKLLNDARSADEAKRMRAIRMLKFLREQGALMALAGEKGPAEKAARAAVFEILHPKQTTETIPSTERGRGKSRTP